MNQEIRKFTVVFTDDDKIRIRFLYCSEEQASEKAQSMAKKRPEWSIHCGHLSIEAKFD
jgi:hypothetical protein